MDINDYISSAEAAKILSERFGSYNQKSVQNSCIRGVIPGAVKIGRNWLVPRQWAETYEAPRKK